MQERTKIIQLDDRFEHTGEPTVQPVVLWGLRGKPCYEQLSKEATHSPALDYIRTVDPEPGRTIVLVIGLSSYEFYGLNRNGDGFNERPYKVNIKPTCGCCGKGRNAWVEEKECVQYHHKSYEQGHVFRHHVNKDPKKAIGKIIKAFWNPYMHRVEILEDIDNKKAPDLVEQITEGQYPAKSMGCRIKFDVCTKCGHMAPTRKHYCDHLKWQLSHLDPTTGERYGALNPSPRLFDSSWVIRPADRTGYMLKKVAHPYELHTSSSELGDLVDALNQKSAAVRKIAVIDKVVRGYPAAMASKELPEGALVEQYRDNALPQIAQSTELLPAETLRTLAVHKLPLVLKALEQEGITLTAPEFMQLFMRQVANTDLPVDLLHHLTALQTEILELFAEHPALLDKLIPALQTADVVPKALKKQTTQLREKRSTISRYVEKRLTPKAFKHDNDPTSDLIEVVDPNTGRVFQTTRKAVQLTQDAMDESQIKKLVGSAGLLAGAYKAVTALPGAARLTVGAPLAGAGLALGNWGLQEPDTYETTTGEKIPQLTEFQEKRSAVLDNVHVAGLEQRFLKRSACRSMPVLQQLLMKRANFGLSDTEISLLNMLPKTASQDGIVGDTPDFDKIATLIGALVCPTINRN